MKSLKYLLTVVEKFPAMWKGMQDIDESYLNKPLPDWKLRLMETVSETINKTIIELDANHIGDKRLEQATSAYLYFCTELYRDWEEDSAK